jgi:cytochrome P450
MAATITHAPGAPPASTPEPRLPPGPRMPAAVQTLIWALAPTWMMDRCARALGEAFTLTFAPSGLKLTMVSDPQAVKTVFTAPPDVAPSAAGMSPLAPVMGRSSVLVLTGPEHMRQRKLLLPPFHGERMREYEDVIVEATKHDMASWPLGKPMRLQRHTRLITLEVILRAVFGVDAERMQPLKDAIGDLFEPVGVLAVLRAVMSRPTGERPTGAIGRALDRLDALIYAEIERRRGERDLQQRPDILSLLLLARDDDGEPMTDAELRDELVTLLLAGHETTATSVAWAVERLVRHPDKLARLIAEIDGVGTGADRGEDEDEGEGEGEGRGGGGDEYMTAVVNETLRVRPVVPLVVRMLTQELQVGPYALPAGTRVVPSIYLTNRNPRVYERPGEFLPERFLDASGTQATNSFSWIPFGGGIRRCIGASFALLEMKVMLRTMLSELEPRLPSQQGPLDALRGGGRSGERITRRAITLVPARGASMVWERRHAGVSGAGARAGAGAGAGAGTQAQGASAVPLAGESVSR